MLVFDYVPVLRKVDDSGLASTLLDSKKFVHLMWEKGVAIHLELQSREHRVLQDKRIKWLPHNWTIRQALHKGIRVILLVLLQPPVTNLSFVHGRSNCDCRSYGTDSD